MHCVIFLKDGNIREPQKPTSEGQQTDNGVLCVLVSYEYKKNFSLIWPTADDFCPFLGKKNGVLGLFDQGAANGHQGLMGFGLVYIQNFFLA